MRGFSDQSTLLPRTMLDTPEFKALLTPELLTLSAMFNKFVAYVEKAHFNPNSSDMAMSYGLLVGL